jgi:hypothetical protein
MHMTLVVPGGITPAMNSLQEVECTQLPTHCSKEKGGALGYHQSPKSHRFEGQESSFEAEYFEKKKDHNDRTHTGHVRSREKGHWNSGCCIM